MLENAVLLENSNLPILEVNSGYPLEVADIAKFERRFLERGKPGILILPEDLDLELAASNAQFLPYSSLVVLEVKPTVNDLVVEQVSWSQALSLARVWCLENAALDWQDLIAKEIACAMQQNPNLTAYLAFENHQPMGMMIALESGFAGWLAGETRALQALTHRLASDFAHAIVVVPLEKSSDFSEARELERLSVWVKIR